MTSEDPSEAGQVPTNLPGLADSDELTDSDDLAEVERRAAYIRVAELEQHPGRITGDFDLAHLQAIHAYLLQDVYEWAGELRRAGEDTRAFGMAHCRPDFLSGEIGRVFGAIARHRPPVDDRDAALATVAEHWGELTGVHPFRDGNSRTQRVFFHRYAQASGWDIDWRAVNPAAVHAARHVAMRTTDSSYLAEVLRPGFHRLGEHPSAGSLAETQGRRSEREAIRIYKAMIEHRATRAPAATFALEPSAGTAATEQTATGPEHRAGPRRTELADSAPNKNDSTPPPAAEPIALKDMTPAQRAAAIASRGVARTSPTSATAGHNPETPPASRPVDRGRTSGPGADVEPER